MERLRRVTPAADRSRRSPFQDKRIGTTQPQSWLTAWAALSFTRMLFIIRVKVRLSAG